MNPGQEQIPESSRPAPGFPPRRLHPATLWLPVADSVRFLAIGVLVAALFAGLLRTVAFVALFVLLPILAYQLSRYATFRYEIRGSDLVLRSGLIWRRERRIPLRRVQDTVIGQGPFHQWLRLASLKITTAGSEGQEAVLDVLSMDEAEGVRRAIMQCQSALAASDRPRATEQHDAAVLLTLPVSTLLLGGISSKLVAALGAMLGAIFYFEVARTLGNRYLGRLGNFVDPLSYLNPVLDRVVPASPPVQKALETADYIDRLTDRYWYLSLLRYFLEDSLGKAVFIILVGMALSAVAFALKHFRYRLERSGSVLTCVAGLFTSSRSSMVQDHVVALKVEESYLWRLFGLASIAVDSGGDQAKAEESKKRESFIPILARNEVPRLVREILPDLQEPEPGWRRVSRKAVLRRSKKGWLVVAALSLLTHLAAGWFSLAWVAALPLVYYMSLRIYRHTGYWADGAYLLSRKGGLNRHTLYLPVRSLQSVIVRESWFDRRLGLATLVVDTAGQTNTGGGASISNLPADEARQIQAALVRSMARTRFTL
jgi:putative membrane protein